MNENLQFDIIVVGGGMVGSATAALLAQSDLKVALVEASDGEPGISSQHFDARVVALSNTSANILKQAKVWGDICNLRLCPYREMYVWDGEGTANISFSCHDIRKDQLGYIIENSVVLSALRKKIFATQNISILQPAKVKNVCLPAAEKLGSPQLECLYQNKQIKLSAKLIVAADGANSSIRTLLNIPTREWNYGHTAIVSTLELEQPHRFTAWQRFSQRGPIALLPLGDDINAKKAQNFCSLVWSAESDLAAKLKEVPDAEFCELLSREFEYKLGKVLSVDERYALPLRQRHAESYVQPGLALVGDAAHTIHPLAGQGVNLGLYDAQVLAEEISRSQQREYDLGDYSILQRYERRRQSHNLLAMSAMEGFKRLFAAQDPAIRWLRNTGMRFFNEQKWLKNKLVQLASG